MSGGVGPKWLGLMRWSMQHDDGTKPTDMKFSEMSGKDKAWLEKVMKECVIDEVELMAQAVAVLRGAPPAEAYAEASEEIRARVDAIVPESEEALEFQADMLEDLQERVEQIDNARTFVKIGGLQPILDVLREGDDGAGLRWRAATVLASIFQNNPPTQDAGLACGAMAQLGGLVRRSSGQSDKVRLKAFNALSCLVRAHDACEEAFLADVGAGAAAAAAAAAAEVASEGVGGGAAAAVASADATAEGAGGGIALLHELLHPEETLQIKIKAAFCLRWFAFARPRCIAECIARGVPALLAAQLREGAGGEEDADVGFRADLREKALDALLQLVAGDADGSAGAREAVRGAELGVEATLQARISALEALTGEDVENAHEELDLARRLALQLSTGAVTPDAHNAAMDAAAAAAAASQKDGPIFTLK